MKRYFYYERSLLGRWCPVIANNPPTKQAETRRVPVTYGLKLLTDRHDTWSLDDCVAEWPMPITATEIKGE
jgi:hypothetical protein